MEVEEILDFVAKNEMSFSLWEYVYDKYFRLVFQHTVGFQPNGLIFCLLLSVHSKISLGRPLPVISNTVQHPWP